MDIYQLRLVSTVNPGWLRSGFLRCVSDSGEAVAERLVLMSRIKRRAARAWSPRQRSCEVAPHR